MHQLKKERWLNIKEKYKQALRGLFTSGTSPSQSKLWKLRKRSAANRDWIRATKIERWKSTISCSIIIGCPQNQTRGI